MSSFDKINVNGISKYFDHTILKSDATISDIDNIVNEAIQYRFKSVCVNSYYVKHCYNRLKDSDVLVCAVVGFPLGTCSTQSKVFEACTAIDDGAAEIDMVINVGLLKSGKITEVKNDLEAVINACHSKQAICKVILETCLLSPDEIKSASDLSLLAGADYIKTSTGFNTSGASTDAVALMVKLAHDVNKRVKASGGIRDGITAMKYIELGADRLGTSATVKIYNDIINMYNSDTSATDDVITKQSDGY